MYERGPARLTTCSGIHALAGDVGGGLAYLFFY